MHACVCVYMHVCVIQWSIHYERVKTPEHEEDWMRVESEKQPSDTWLPLWQQTLSAYWDISFQT